MSEPRKPPIPFGGKLFIAAVGAIGTAIFAWSAIAVATQPLRIEVWLFAALTVVAGHFKLKIPSISSYLSVSEMFTFSSVLLFGPEAAAIMMALDSLVLAYRCRMRAVQAFFNFGNLTLSVWIAGQLFFLTAGGTPLIDGSAPIGNVLLPLGLLASTYFLVNSGLTATVVAFASQRRARRVWREHYMWLAPSYAAGASVALLLVVALRQVHFSVIAVVPPLLFISYLTLRSSFGRLEDAKQHVAALNRLYLSTIETLATAIDAKDEVTHGHVRRVQIGAVGLAKQMGVTDDTMLKAIEAAALLHDTGKIAIPEHILNKPGRLTPAEFEKMKMHAPIGAEMLSAIDFPYPVVPIVRHHHENWDGTGYPDKIGGESIPLGARILSVVDCFDALTSDRPYRRRMTDDQALAILRERRGTMYDPAVVDTFIRSYKSIMPEAETEHPAARAVGGARQDLESTPEPATQVADIPVGSDLLALTSLSRAMSGEASVADVGALAWMTLRSAVPSQSMALFVIDDARDAVRVAYAAGSAAAVLRNVRQARGAGVAGWSAANRRPVLNAEPALDLGIVAREMDPPLRSSLTVPVLHDGNVIAVLSLYAVEKDAFVEDHLRLLQLVAPSLAASVAAAQTAESNAPPIRRAAGDFRLVKA